jgi:rhamnosyltransferase subunit B
LRKFVIATLGSLGDVFPLLAIARACQDQGFEVIFAANKSFEATIESHGLKFAPFGATRDAMVFPRKAAQDAAVPFIEQALDQLDAHFDELMELSAGAAALLAPYWVLPAHIVAEKLGIPHVACAFSPAYLARGRDAGTGNGSRLRVPARWHQALATMRRRMGLRRALLPYAELFTAPTAMLGLFPHFMSRGLAPAHARTIVCGYPHLRQASPRSTDTELLEFCDPSTVTFSFGSYVDEQDARHLFEESVAACRALGLKCCYLSAFVTPPRESAADVLVRPFVDHDLVFPRSAMVVHHAGMGTLMSACRSRAPMLCVPSVYDQPHNARVMTELVGAPCVPITRYSRQVLIGALVSAMNAKEATVARLHELMGGENDGVPVAADVLGRLVEQPGSRAVAAYSRG